MAATTMAKESWHRGREVETENGDLETTTRGRGTKPWRLARSPRSMPAFHSVPLAISVPENNFGAASRDEADHARHGPVRPFSVTRVCFDVEPESSGFVRQGTRGRRPSRTPARSAAGGQEQEPAARCLGNSAA